MFRNNTKSPINRINGWLNTEFTMRDFKYEYDKTYDKILQIIKEREIDYEQYILLDNEIDKLSKGKGLPFYTDCINKHYQSMI